VWIENGWPPTGRIDRFKLNIIKNSLSLFNGGLLTSSRVSAFHPVTSVARRAPEGSIGSTTCPSITQRINFHGPASSRDSRRRPAAWLNGCGSSNFDRGIFATALGPVLLGGLFQAGVTFAAIIPTAAILGTVAVAVSLMARALILNEERPARRG
jgi:hypothetical protein